LIGFDVEHNALNETFEVVDNNLVDVGSYQLLAGVDHKHEVVEVDPLLLKDDYLVEHHTFHVLVEQN
jgi:DNA polymerase III epsilon subunit-like protein